MLTLYGRGDLWLYMGWQWVVAASIRSSSELWQYRLGVTVGAGGGTMEASDGAARPDRHANVSSRSMMRLYMNYRRLHMNCRHLQFTCRHLQFI